MIVDFAKRLGIVSDRTIRKAQEYERLIQLKISGASKFHVKGVSQQIICLDLASEAENNTVDKEMLLKLSGLKKPVYNSSKQTVKQVLGINEEILFRDVCVQLGCPEIVNEAENLFKLYQTTSCNGKNDLDHPGFKAAVVMALSKVKKLGVNRIKLQEMSGLKKSVFDKLVLSMSTLHQQENQKPLNQSKASKRTYSFIETVEAKARALDEESSQNQETTTKEVDFASWKRRMLEEANAKDSS